MAPKMSGKEVIISVNGQQLQGILSIPDKAKGIVLFAHGSGSGRFSPRNQYVAKKLQEGKLGTLLMDLLTQDEDVVDERTRQFRFDIELLAARLIGTVDWLGLQAETKAFSVGYFGASTGAAAALVAAAAQGKKIKAVVSRGGRPDLAADALCQVSSPTLLIVGGQDIGVIELNQNAYAKLRCTKKLEIVPGATHLFEEPGALDNVADLALSWFTEYL